IGGLLASAPAAADAPGARLWLDGRRAWNAVRTPVGGDALPLLGEVAAGFALYRWSVWWDGSAGVHHAHAVDGRVVRECLAPVTGGVPAGRAAIWLCWGWCLRGFAAGGLCGCAAVVGGGVLGDQVLQPRQVQFVLAFSAQVEALPTPIDADRHLLGRFVVAPVAHQHGSYRHQVLTPVS